MTAFTANDVAAIATCVAAASFDLHRRRIPNVLTFASAGLALSVASVSTGLGGAANCVTGWFVAIAMWLPFYAVGGIGGGDVKLMAAVGAWVGPVTVAYAAIYTAIAGAIYAVGVMTARRCARQTLSNIQLLVAHWRVAGVTAHPDLTLATATSPRLAYALPILTGTVIALWLR